MASVEAVGPRSAPDKDRAGMEMDSVSGRAMLRHGGDNGEYRRIELITGTSRRRRWSDEEKAALIAESFLEGVNVSALARRVGVNCGLLHTWRREARRTSVNPEPAFVPVLVEAANSGSEVPLTASAPKIDVSATDAAPSGTIEIESGDLRIRVQGSVDMSALQAVLSRVGRRR